MKNCFKCHRELPLDGFYKHHQMPDGHLNKCKECTKEDVRKNRLKNIEYYREYDRIRGNRQYYEYISEYRERYQNKYKATNIVNNSIRSKKLFREDCEICGDEFTHAHHDDYLKPLNVRWLCAACHKKWHKYHGEGLNP